MRMSNEETDIIGVNISIDASKNLNDLESSQIQSLLFKHKVVIINNQQLTDEELLKFALNFGAIFESNNTKVLGSESGGTPAVVVVGNNDPKYKEAFLGHQEVLPHSDHQWIEKPSSISMLYAIDITEGSAATKWTDMTAVYDSLPDELKSVVSDKLITTFNPFYRPFGEVFAKYVNRAEDTPPGECVSHPLVRTHPYTKKKILYMHRAYEMEFHDEVHDVGVNLWNTLNEHIDKSESCYEHFWENGDIVIWDNRATIHYRKQFDSKTRRVLKRVSIAGEKPF
jgi:taurine dioxygenase